ncbi:MAG: hypothetical protein Q8P35_02280 [Candidatus Yanofskybacteria bacterium]|nr:hypothetical protein [Candidatus Yanofskybacteria bacterium]
MAYILILTLLFSGVIAAALGFKPLSGITEKIRGSVSDIAFPKSPEELIIENVQEKYESIDRFFSGAANEIIKSKNIPEAEKKQLRDAFQAFTESKSLLDDLKEKEGENEGVVELLIKKIIPGSEPGPTSIPPNCSIQCD